MYRSVYLGWGRQSYVSYRCPSPVPGCKARQPVPVQQLVGHMTMLLSRTEEQKCHFHLTSEILSGPGFCFFSFSRARMAKVSAASGAMFCRRQNYWQPETPKYL